MVNVAKHIEYWKGGAEEDIAAAGSLLEKGHPRHALFFAHLAVETGKAPLVSQMVLEEIEREPAM